MLPGLTRRQGLACGEQTEGPNPLNCLPTPSRCGLLWARGASDVAYASAKPSSSADSRPTLLSSVRHWFPSITYRRPAICKVSLSLYLDLSLFGHTPRRSLEGSTSDSTEGYCLRLNHRNFLHKQAMTKYPYLTWKEWLGTEFLPPIVAPTLIEGPRCGKIKVTQSASNIARSGSASPTDASHAHHALHAAHRPKLAP